MCDVGPTLYISHINNKLMNIVNKINKNVPLAPLTTFKIGGPAKFFLEAKNQDELIEGIKWAKENNHKLFILGGGSNILFSDNGFDGLVIKNEMKELKIADEKIIAEAGVLVSNIIRLAFDNNLKGMERFCGLPGTIGGAVRGNAGCFGIMTSEIVDQVKCLNINDLTIKEINNSGCDFAYRQSRFKTDAELLLLEVVMNLEKAENIDELRKVAKECVMSRNKNGSYDYPSAGCIFTNPVTNNNELLKRVGQDIDLRENKIPAGWLIEELGLKGKRIGGAQILEKNANFIVNVKNAKATDVVTLISLVKQKVRDKFGIQLMEEVVYVGFDE